MSISHFVSVVSAASTDGNVIPEVALSNTSISASRSTLGGFSTAQCIYRLQDDGVANEQHTANPSADTLTSPTTFNATDWRTDRPQIDIGDDFEAFVTVTATNGVGTFGGDSQDTWVSLGDTVKLWQLTFSGDNVEATATRSFSVTIRDVATQTTQATATVSMTCELFGP